MPRNKANGSSPQRTSAGSFQSGRGPTPGMGASSCQRGTLALAVADKGVAGSDPGRYGCDEPEDHPPVRPPVADCDLRNEHDEEVEGRHRASEGERNSSAEGP